MSAIAVYALATYITISTTGTIATAKLSANPSVIEWGIVELSIPITKNVTLTNIGTTTLSNLNMTTNNPTGLTDYSVSWNQEGVTLNPGDSALASFTLTVIDYDNANFSFDINITWTNT